MKYRHKQGMTFIEILITIAIIGILSSIVLNNVSTARQKAKIAVAKEELISIRNSVVLLESDSKKWPNHLVPDTVDDGTAANEVWNLASSIAGLYATDGLYLNWNGPYIPQEGTIDPWGNNYFLDTDYKISTSPDVWVTVIGSFGPNGVGQNLFDSDDVILIIAGP